MLKTTKTNQLLDTESNLWEDLNEEQSQSVAGGLNTVVPVTFGSITAYPPQNTSGILSPQPQNPPFKIPSTKG